MLRLHAPLALLLDALVPPADPEALAGAARRVLRDAEEWRRLRDAGLEVARGFSEERAGSEAEAAVAWALERPAS